MRRYLIAGNWKMNMTETEGISFVKELNSNIKNSVYDNVDVLVVPPFTALSGISKILKGTKIKLGAQNINENEKGAYTGEVSADMLLDLKVEYVVIGHSERRTIYKESNELINKKVVNAIKKGLKVILCVGELLSEREANKTNEVVKTQIVEGLKNVSKEDMKSIVIAYEPVWAIGTGKVATPEQAEEVHAFIREIIIGMYDKGVADNLIIQYGGSVNDSNVDGLMNKPNIDGALVGGASLKIDSFTRIAEFKKI